ncbi:FecR protein [Planctomycetes bacterium CA13]|uniref:FecR protein n=1 Tax=Novipirellula herctigrandis TaxID=2527986 RepID=A0A5C5ZBD2_9BACT|nr:FecR protein [Planctomycetes bacterium CA13]
MFQRTHMTAKLDNLIDRYCAGLIERSELEELQSMLLDNPEFRSRYFEVIRLHAELHELADVDAGIIHDTAEDLLVSLPEPESVSRLETSSETSSRYGYVWMAMAAIASTSALLLAGVVWRQADSIVSRKIQRPIVISTTEVVASKQSDDDNYVETPTVLSTRRLDSIALLRDSVDAVWAADQMPIRVGDEVFAHTLHLESGLVELALLNGATVIVDGPAKLELVSRLRGVLHHGKVRCFVPPAAQGFTLETTETRYVDLGTEFGVEVTLDGREELHVFDGEVEVHPRGVDGPPKLIESGYGLNRPNQDGNWETISSDADKFAGGVEMLDRSLQHDEKQYQAWRKHMERLRHDPELVVLYDFEPTEGRRSQLANLKQDKLHGSVFGCEWSTGRWKSKGALDFKRPSNRVRLNLPGTYENITLMAWLRIDGFDRKFNSILLSDEFEPGNIHWQILSSGKLNIGLKPPEGDRRLYQSSSVLGYDDLGSWINLAAVVDQKSGFVSHYLDGKLVSRHEIHPGLSRSQVVSLDPIALRFGPSDLGNWSPAREYDQWLIRNFNGRIDEFAMFQRALSHQEIADLFAAGCP